MSDVRFPRPFVLLLAALLFLTMFHCRPYAAPQVSAFQEEDLTLEQVLDACKSGNYSKGRPLICVDATTLRPNFDPAQVWDFEGSNGQPTTRPVTVQWRASNGGNLAIRFATGSNCVGPVNCNGKGKCVAQVQALGKDEMRQCKYDIILDGRENDPDFIVNPCCW